MKYTAKVVTGGDFVVGVTSSGNVKVAGTSEICSIINNLQLTNIIDISAYSYNKFAYVKDDGTCGAVGTLASGNDINSIVKTWTNIKRILVSYDYVIGIKNDGTCVGVGYYWYNTSKVGTVNVSLFSNIIDFWTTFPSASLLLKDVEGNVFYQGKTYSTSFQSKMTWTNAKNAIYAGGGHDHIQALLTNGTVVEYGGYGSMSTSNVTYAFFFFQSTLAIKNDGNYTSTVWGDSGLSACQSQMKAQQWEKKEFIQWDLMGHNGATIAALNADGTVSVVSTVNKSLNSLVSDWNLLEFHGLCISQKPINLLDKTNVNNLLIHGTEPIGTERRVIFKIEEIWYKFSAEGKLTPLTQTINSTVSNITNKDITADYVLNNGNTASELMSLTNISDFIGKLIYFAVALYASKNATTKPTFGMTINAEIDTTVNTYTKTDYSQQYILHSTRDVLINNIVVDSEVINNASVAITARYAIFDENNSEQIEIWSDYMDLSSVINKKAHKLQIKVDYSVSDINELNTATVNTITIFYMTNVGIVSENKADILTASMQNDNNSSYCYALVKHNQLIDSELKAYAEIKGKTNEVLMEYIGSGNNTLTEYTLSHANVLQDSIKVYINNALIQNFDYENNVIKLSAPTNEDIYVTYQYYTSTPTEIEMTREYTRQEGNQYLTRFSCDLSSINNIGNVSVKYSLIKLIGSVNNEVLGQGNGKTQTFKLPHNAKKESITCNCSYNYNQETKFLTVIQNKNEDIIISYDYNGESPQLTKVFVGLA